MSKVEITPDSIHEIIPPHEIEKKYLVKKLPDNLDSFPFVEISQSYVAISEDNKEEVRVRKADNNYYLTVKRGNGLDREEVETCIDRDTYEVLVPHADGKTVEKTRYKIPYQKYTIELDVYHGAQEGLLSVEVEFESIEESEKFAHPAWFGEDVTGKKEFSNRAMAGKNAERTKEKTSESWITTEVEDVSKFLNLIEKKLKEKDGSESLFVFIAGRTSSGKTTAVTKKIEERFGDISILSTDDYQKGGKFVDRERAKGNNINWDHPEYINFELLKTHLDLLKNGESIEKPEFNFLTGEADSTSKFSPKNIIVLEGLFALFDDLPSYADVKGFVDISLHGSVVRRLARDVVRTPLSPEQILDYYFRVVEPMYQKYIEPTKRKADMVLVNEYNPAIEAEKFQGLEIQAKYKGTVSAELLADNGATFLKCNVQDDTYFNPHDRQLEESDEMLRIRKEDGQSVMTYKGPKNKDSGNRPRAEIKISPRLERIFRKHYGKNFKEISKERSFYEMDGALVVLDTVTKIEGGVTTKLGEFIEIQCNDEKNSEEKTSQIVKKLGITTLPLSIPYSRM